MKRAIGTVAVLLAILAAAALSSFSQATIENPAKPLAKDAGRILQLTEVWRITDESGEFYFRYPRDLKIADDGSIFLRDIDQFLKFTPDGEFLRNLYKKGQGPGEMKDSAFHYDLRGQDLYVLDRNARRFWRADLEGRFQESIDITAIVDPELVAALPEGSLFLTFIWPGRDKFTGKSAAVPHTLVLAGRSGRTTRDLKKFARSFFLAPHNVLFDQLIMAPSQDGKNLYMFNGWDYLIEAVDLVSGATTKRFRRRYAKFSPPPLTEEQEKRRQESGMPRYEFMPDINNLYPTDGRLWVETSTNDKAKGRLYDVFDKDGRFLDSFYLGAGRTLMAVQDGAVFCQEKSGDETITIVKYWIVK